MEAARKASKSATAQPRAALRRAPPAQASRAAALQSRLGTSGVATLMALQIPAAPSKTVPRSPASSRVRPPAGDQKRAPLRKGDETDPSFRASVAGPVAPLHMPEPPAAPSKATLQRIAGVRGRAGGTADAQSTLPPAAQQVGDAQASVTLPEAELGAEARASLIASVNASPSSEILKIAADIRRAIRERRPPDEDALLKAEPTREAAEAGQQLNASIEGEASRIQSNYASLDGQPQSAPAAPSAQLPPQPAAAPTAPMNAKAAVPDAVSAGAVSLDKDAAVSASRIDEAGMTSPAAAEVRNGPIAEARAAQGELDQVAREDPRLVLAKQQEALAKADTDMGALQMEALEALTVARAGTVTRTSARQRNLVESEEQQRTDAGNEATVVFDKAQAAVRALLKPLIPTAMEKWEAARTALTAQFKNDLQIVKDRVDERHSGVTGAIVGLWDAVTGLPDWATEAYDRAENNFADGVIARLTEISVEVNSVIKACEVIIVDARTRIREIFAGLPESLRTWAAKEQARFDGQFDSLGQEVAATRDGFNKDVSRRAVEAVDEVRTEIAELREKAGGLIGRIVAAVKRFVDDPVKFVIDGLLELLGIPPPAFWAVIARIKKVVRSISDDPVGFANKLLGGIGRGFSQFFENFPGHMIRSFLTWMLGDLKDVQVPKDISVKSIISFFLQLMGITWPNIRKILARKIGEKNIELIEKVYSLISMLVEQGPQGIYEMIKEKLDPQSIVEQVVQLAVDFMTTAIMKQVATRVALLFNPAGAILQAIEAIYRVLKWVFQNAAKIFTLVETIVNGMADIIAGNVSGFAKAVERGLSMLISPVLAFIADYFSLGDLPQIVAKKIKEFRDWILGKIDAGFDWLIAKGKALLKAVGVVGGGRNGYDGKASVGESVGFELPGESHLLYLIATPSGATLMVASEMPMKVSDKLRSFETRLRGLPAEKASEAKKLIDRAGSLVAGTNLIADSIAKERARNGKEDKDNAESAAVVAAEKELAPLLRELYLIFGEVGRAPVVGTYLQIRSRPDVKDQEAHHVPPKGVGLWIWDVADAVVRSLNGSPFAETVDYTWIKNLKSKDVTVFNPGHTLSAIGIHKETHIRKSGDPTRDVWRVHWGEQTARAVFAKLAGRMVAVVVDGKQIQLSMVFIRRRLYSELSDEDKILLREMEREAGEQLSGLDVGEVPDAVGRVISTQFFKTELWEALREAQVQAGGDVGRIEITLGMVVRGAAAQAFAAVEVALEASKVDGSEDEKAKALGQLKPKAREAWYALGGMDRLRFL